MTSGDARAAESPTPVAVTTITLPLHRQRYECTCGFHGTREEYFPPAHIRCPRCNGVGVARGEPERV